MAKRRNLREFLLERPVVYGSFQRLVGSKRSSERFVATALAHDPSTRVLDLGCGYGYLSSFFRCGRYVGLDSNPRYIERARRDFVRESVEFMEGELGRTDLSGLGTFDLVVMTGVLHHLPSDVAKSTVAAVRPLLSPGGRFVCLEPVFEAGQGLLARLIIAADRGQHVRDIEGYEALFASSFPKVDARILRGMLRIPYTHVVVTASL